MPVLYTQVQKNEQTNKQKNNTNKHPKNLTVSSSGIDQQTYQLTFDMLP